MYVKPQAGTPVPDPEKGGLLPPAGRKVEPTAYWLRRLTAGDVVEVTLKHPAITKSKGADK